MRKLILSFITFIGTIAISQELNIKVGYNFFRHINYTLDNLRVDEHVSNLNHFNYIRGFVVGVEVLPLTFKEERIKLGLGFEYDFGSVYVVNIMPLYATAKFTYYRPKKIDLNLYTFARIGYAFSKDDGIHYDTKNTSGLYYGLGLGLDYKYFLAEFLYDGKYSKGEILYDGKDQRKHEKLVNLHSFYHKIGIRLGLQLGTQHFKKCPNCTPKMIEKKVEVLKVVEKKTTNKIIIEKFDISSETLFEFNKSKLQDLKENGKKEIEKKVKELSKSGFEITGINVIGHTDRLGTDTYNYKLGLNRADTIARYLKELGIKVEIKSSSKGKTEPKVHCNNIKSTSKLKECLQPNRRVEIQFIGFETQKKVEEVIENK